MTRTMKLLVAYDGSPCADVMLDDLQRAGLPEEVEATVLSVADVWFMPEEEHPVSPTARQVSASLQKARALAKAAVDDAFAVAERGCERLQRDFPTWKVTAEARAASPAWGIILRAEELSADLIVIGSHSRSAMGRMVLGSVSQTVVTQAHCSVRVAREHGAEAHRPVRILVGVDGSQHAEAAVQAVAERNWPPESDVGVLVAINSQLSTAVELPGMEQWTQFDAPGPEPHDENGWVRNFVEAAADQLRTTELAVSTLIKGGDPKKVLLDEAERWGADCIFVGARGLNRLERLMLGSVSTAVAARAHCSVEIVRSASKSQNES